jgi:hypothetical protein
MDESSRIIASWTVSLKIGRRIKLELEVNKTGEPAAEI